MANTKIGTYSSPVNFPSYPTYERDVDGRWTVAERYWILTSNINVDLPANEATVNQFGETVLAPNGNAVFCQEASISAGSAPDISEITLTYREAEILEEKSSSFKSVNDNAKSVRLRSEEIPIDDERLLDTNGGPYSQSDIDDKKKAGYLSLMLYLIEYEYSDLDASFDWTESNIVSSLQDAGVPPGVSGGTAANWRLIGKEINETNDGTIIRSNYEYSPSGF